MKSALRFAEYASLRIVAFVLTLTPLPLLRFAAARAGALMMFAVPIRRKVALENLERAFPKLSDRERRALLHQSYNNLCTMFFELLKAGTMSAEEIMREWTFERLDLIENASGGAVLLSAHYGNWEWLAIAGALAAKKNVLVVTKEQKNSHVDGFIDSLRTRFGNRMIGMDNVRGMIAHIRSGGLIALLGDQAASQQSVETTFFGETLPTFAGAATLALKLNVSLIFTVAHRKPDGSYSAHFREVPRTRGEHYTKEDVTELTQRHVAMLEEEIRRSPGEWLWLHRRWKHSRARPA